MLPSNSNRTPLNQTLRSLTHKKLSTLSHQIQLYNSQKSALYSSLSNAIDSTPNSAVHQNLKILLSTLSSPHDSSLGSQKRTHFDAVPPEDKEKQLFRALVMKDQNALEAPLHLRKRLDVFLTLAEKDEGCIGGCNETYEDFVEATKEMIERQGRRLEMARVWGELIKDWLIVMEDSNQGDGEDFEVVGIPTEGEYGGEDCLGSMEEQRETFEKLVFEPHPNDLKSKETQDKIRGYLDALFSLTPENTDYLKSIRIAMRKASKAFLTLQLSTNGVKLAITSLLQSDLLSNGKRIALQEIMNNNLVLKELQDILNVCFSNLPDWSWAADGEKGIALEIRRQLNGKYRVFMDEDLIQSIFLHYLGVSWSISFKQALLANENAWRGAGVGRPTMSRKEVNKRNHFGLDIEWKEGGCEKAIARSRDEAGRNTYLLNQLYSSFLDSGKNYYEDEEPDKKNDQEEDCCDYCKEQQTSPMEIKQKILRLLMTELNLNLSLRGHFTILQTDFRWFGPSLSHLTILTVLKFFGIFEEHISFFAKFLSIPCYFVEDSLGGETKIRKRGVPMSHALSNMFGEIILYILDFAVNQASDGNVFLYRMYDDLWLWNSEPEACVSAWKEIQKFCETFGLELNEEKTGSVFIGKEQDQPPDAVSLLPKGAIRWGFLNLQEDGTLKTDAKILDTHISWLTKQLQACASVLQWTQAWNKYFGNFLSYHLGHPSPSLGIRHLDMIMSELDRVQRFVLKGLNTGKDISLTGYLRKLISEKVKDMDVEGIPEGWFYWPFELGGLAMHNPVVDLFKFRAFVEHFKEVREKLDFEERKKLDLITYRKGKKDWDNATNAKRSKKIKSRKGGSDSDDEFMDNEPEEYLGFDEYASNIARETRSGLWAFIYDQLQWRGDSWSLCPLMPAGGIIQAQLEKQIQGMKARNENGAKVLEAPYWTIIAGLYGDRVLARFGSLEIVDPELVPVGLVKVMRNARFRWQH